MREFSGARGSKKILAHRSRETSVSTTPHSGDLCHAERVGRTIRSSTSDGESISAPLPGAEAERRHTKDATMSMKTKLFAAAAAAVMISAVSAGTAFADGFTNTSTPGFTIGAGTGPRFDTAVAGGTSFPTVGAFN